jgi:predicted nucleic acid-binding protein
VPVVVDASALVELLIRSDAAPAVEAALRDEDGFAPELLDAEVVSAVAGLERSRKLSAGGARRAVTALARAPITRVSHGPLLSDVWELRRSVGTYDAFYAALARRVDCPLVTGDRRLAEASRLGLAVVLVR